MVQNERCNKRKYFGNLGKKWIFLFVMIGVISGEIFQNFKENMHITHGLNWSRAVHLSEHRPAFGTSRPAQGCFH
jgi:hypothetical protein